jgi:DNA-binding GntR family transcriptional regulator
VTVTEAGRPSTRASAGVPSLVDLPPSRTTKRLQLRDEVVSHIRQLIIAGKVLPGTVLRLAPLAETVQASVTPVREALLLLVQDGWVTQEPNRGFRVAAIRRVDVEDAYTVYSFVAGELASRAARSINEQELERLRALDHQIEVADRDDAERIEGLNYELHQVVYDAAESPRLVWFVDAASRFVPRRYWASIDGWWEHNRTGHAVIIQALAAGDSAAAGERMSAHVDQSGALLLAHLDRSGFWTSETDGE